MTGLGRRGGRRNETSTLTGRPDQAMHVVNLAHRAFALRHGVISPVSFARDRVPSWPGCGSSSVSHSRAARRGLAHLMWAPLWGLLSTRHYRSACVVVFES